MARLAEQVLSKTVDPGSNPAFVYLMEKVVVKEAGMVQFQKSLWTTNKFRGTSPF